MAQCSYKLPPVERHVDIVFCIDGTGGLTDIDFEVILFRLSRAINS